MAGKAGIEPATA